MMPVGWVPTPECPDGLRRETTEVLSQARERSRQLAGVLRRSDEVLRQSKEVQRCSDKLYDEVWVMSAAREQAIPGLNEVHNFSEYPTNMRNVSHQALATSPVTMLAGL